jgi:hypothetical protein
MNLMPKPDFEAIARRLIVLIDPDGADEDESPVDDLHRQAIAIQLAAVVEQVRQVSNARGAADREKLLARLATPGLERHHCQWEGDPTPVYECADVDRLLQELSTVLP